MVNDPLAQALSVILNSQKAGKDQCMIRPSSKIAEKVLEIMNQHHYIGAFEQMKGNKGNMGKVALTGSINSCGAIKPRYSIRKSEFEKFEKRYLPAKDFGLLIISTPKGIMTHKEAKIKGLGGVLLAFCY
ncbi:30S ribosomal protein S8 [Candidatus Woesearchaeota archaeon]|nr:30S ribosomal protein S8 [Candidatus Woesearchaeota archaeon]